MYGGCQLCGWFLLKMNESLEEFDTRPHNCSEILLDLGFYGSYESPWMQESCQEETGGEKNLPLCSNFGSAARPWGCGQGPATAVYLGWVTQISGPFCLYLQIGGQVLVRKVKARAGRRVRELVTRSRSVSEWWERLTSAQGLSSLWGLLFAYSRGQGTPHLPVPIQSKSLDFYFSFCRKFLF